jgi:signal transduction histidine kinase
MRRLALPLLAAAAVAFGVAAQWVAFSWDEPQRWAPDLAVGLALAGAGYLASRRRRGLGAGALLAATGLTWFLGNFAAAALYLHRGPLLHLLLAYPGWKPRTWVDLAAVGAAYAAALAAPVWAGDVPTIVFAAVVLAVAARGYWTAFGRTRRHRLVALQATAVLAAALAGGAAARLAVPAGDAVEPALLVYQVALVAVAVLLLAGLREPATTTVADLVVELSETRSGTLRDALARALGEPTLELGYWSGERGEYVDDAGNTVGVPAGADGRSATFVERHGERFAVLVHDSAVLADSALVEAVAAATRLASSNVTLRAEAEAQIDELTASRRRLLVAAEDERRRLEQRLREGPQQRLAALAELLGRVETAATGPAAAHVTEARTHARGTLEDLGELARGLHPRALEEHGLEGALAELAHRSALPVDVRVAAGALPREVEAAAYFVLSEALANVGKHARASRATVAVEQHGDRLALEVVDDGAGGADLASGSGLRGLADRVEALGGRLEVESPPGVGTRLAAELPLDGRR